MHAFPSFVDAGVDGCFLPGFLQVAHSPCLGTHVGGVSALVVSLCLPFFSLEEKVVDKAVPVAEDLWSGNYGFLGDMFSVIYFSACFIRCHSISPFIFFHFSYLMGIQHLSLAHPRTQRVDHKLTGYWSEFPDK